MLSSTNLQDYLDTLTKADIDITKLGIDYFHNSVHQPFIDRIIKNLENRFDDKSVIAA